MRSLAVLFIHFIATLARLLGPGGARSIVAESLLLKHQLLIVNRFRQRSPNLSAWDRILAGCMALLVRPTRLLRSAIVLKPSTLLGLHQAMSKRKYRRLFSPNPRRKAGPKGPSVPANLDAAQPGQPDIQKNGIVGGCCRQLQCLLTGWGDVDRIRLFPQRSSNTARYFVLVFYHQDSHNFRCWSGTGPKCPE